MKKYIQSFDLAFTGIHRDSNLIIQKTPEKKLFWKPVDLYKVFSVGELILRSAGRVEQTIGGITTRLWDDPFEWTLPEEISKKEKIFAYLEEVEQKRQNGFKYFSGDEDLLKKIQAPDKIKTLFDVLLETTVQASNLQGQARSILEIISTES